KFNDDVTAKTLAMFQKIEELNQRMAMCEKRMRHVVDKFKDFSEEKRNECKQLEGKANILKASKSMDLNGQNQESWDEKMGQAMSNLQSSVDNLGKTKCYCYILENRSEKLIAMSEKLDVPFTSNEWDRITGKNGRNN
uniref:Spc7 domain-containing protein n=1 Tax=Strongyloides papillosus TaxID=174720 RepID=A0A0N5C5K4_STREA